MLFNPFHSIIGLDIGDETVKAVRLDVRHWPFAKTKALLAECEEQRLPEGAMVEGEIMKPEEVLRAVKDVCARAMGKSKVPWISCALPETKTFIKLLSTSSNPEMISAQKISELAENELPIPMDESYVDWQIIPYLSTDASTKILMGAVLKKTADAYTYLLNIAGFTPLALEVEAMSILRALIPPHTAGTHLILDIGQTSTTFIMYSAETIQCTLSFAFSGNLLTTRIQQALACTLEEAERIKTICGMDYEHCICHKKNTTEQCNIKPIMEHSMEEFALHIKEGIAFFSEHFNNTEQVDSIILSGGGGQMLFLDKEINKKTNIKVVRGNPLSQIQLSPALAQKPARPLMRFATAIGLGLRILNSPFTSPL